MRALAAVARGLLRPGVRDARDLRGDVRELGGEYEPGDEAETHGGDEFRRAAAAVRLPVPGALYPAYVGGTPDGHPEA